MKMMRRSLLFLLPVLGVVSVQAAEIDFIEDFALSTNREEAIKQLIPGTEDCYYYQCLNFQNQGQFDKVAQTLAAWINRYGHTPRVEEIRNRQALLSYDKDANGTLAFLKNQLGLTFAHQREIMGQKPSHPTRLDQKMISREVYKARAFANQGNLGGFENSAMEFLVAEKLNPELRRDLLRRLERPDYPNLVELVNEDLNYQYSQGFGAFPIHQKMLLPQLESLLKLRPAILNEVNFVNIYISKLQPGPDVDWKHDAKAREAYLATLWDFVKKLNPAHNSLKAHVLFQRLVHDRALGIYDNDRFMEYLKLPRSVFYINPAYLQRADNINCQANIQMDFRSVTSLPIVQNDEPLVRDYLVHFFVKEDSFAPYSTYLLDVYLKAVFAETKILNGIGDMEKWYSLLNDPGKYQEIKDRIEIEFAPTDKTFFLPEEPVALDVDIKNVKTLIVKVFEINTMNYYRENPVEVNTGIDLDGLVAGEEKTYTYSDAPVRRMRRHFEFPALNRRGVYVVEFIGNGKSSRALVCKGQFNFLERQGAAGHVFTILDEKNSKKDKASIWLAGHEYKADKNGTITIPYSTSPGRQTILISCDGFTTLDHFDQQREVYDLKAGIYVDREALLKRAKAKVLIRPMLTLNGVPVALSLLEEPSLLIQSADLRGVQTSKEIKGLKLVSGEETVCEFQVPENMISLGFTLKGRVQSLSENKKLDLSEGASFALNLIDKSDKIEDINLSRVESGYILRILGKTGEPLVDRPVNLGIYHRDFKQPEYATVQTDAGGRIDLGRLDGIVALQVSSQDGMSRHWSLPRQDRHTYPASVNGTEGGKLTIPYMGKAAAVAPSLFSMLEMRGNTYVQDHLKSLAITNGFLEITGLPAGTYDLLMKESNTRITVDVTKGEEREGYVLGENRLLEVRNPAPLQISQISADEKSVKIQLVNSTDLTRVHAVATRFRPAYDIFKSLTAQDMSPVSIVLAKSDSAYVSGRDIGDEYRYILDRKYAQKYPGNMLARPSLILNPWVLRQTETGAQSALEGGHFGNEKEQNLRAYGGGAGGSMASGIGNNYFANLDFLPVPAPVLANLRPDKDGIITISRKDLGEGQEVHVVAVNPGNTVYRELILPETKLVAKDLRLLDGLEPAKHFTEQKQITVIGADKNLVLNDITTAKIEVLDSIGKVYRLFSTLSHNPVLAEFGFITDWPNMKPAEQREKYSKYACHELNFFLYRKDPKFFEGTVLPALKNKKEKTFMDRWLIGDDLAGYLKPWAYGQLNTVERILLAQRIKEEAPAAARHVKDLQDLIPPNLDRLNELFLTAIQGSALEADGYLKGFEEKAKDASRYKLARATKELREVTNENAPAPAAPPAETAAAEALPAVMAEAAFDKVEAKKPAVLGMRMAKTVEKARMRQSAGEKRDGLLSLEDAEKREEVRQLYRKLDKTQELAENNYYHLPIESQNAALVTVNPFWVDYAKNAVKDPFFSTHVAEASRNFTEMMLAMAVLDLPFDGKEPGTAYDGAKMTMTAKSPMVAFYMEIKESAADKNATPLLVSQNFFRASDRYRFENGERFDKFITDEFLTHVVYGCQVVVTDPTSSPLKLEILQQIPRGAIPVNNGFFTDSKPVQMDPYSTRTFEYYFYFPVPGAFGHYPVHVARNGQMVASAQPVTMKVVDTPTKIDTTSWDYVSQNGKPEEVLTFLDTDNPNRLNLERIAWRMREKDFFGKAIDLLSRRHVYNQTLWSYGIHNNDPAAIREYLQHNDGFLAQCGSYLDCTLVTIDPVVRKSYQHLEYSPLVNARAHQLGKKRQILNDRFAQQYHSLMKVLSYRQKFDDADLMSLTYYMLLQDRIEEAQRFFGRLDRKQTAMQMQYDYIQAYLDFYTPEHKVARSIAKKYADYPVDRWRNVFADVMSQIDEIDGKGTSVIDKENRDQLMAKLAATEGSLEFTVESRKITVNYQNITAARVDYYLMDVELLFSRNPFVQQRAGQFAFIQPNSSESLKLPADKKTLTFDLPEKFKNSNVMVEIVAGGIKKSQPYFANSLTIQLIENYGQIKVAKQKTDAPLSKVYIKVYARMKDGSVRFYKDGYTDLRGKFDYTSLNTNELDNVAKFSILVLSEADGAVIREANPPKQ